MDEINIKNLNNFKYGAFQFCENALFGKAYSEEGLKSEEIKSNKINFLNIFENMRIFKIDEKIMSLLNPKTTKNDISYKNLPFESIYIPNEIIFENLKIKGLCVFITHIIYDSEIVDDITVKKNKTYSEDKKISVAGYYSDDFGNSKFLFNKNICKLRDYCDKTLKNDRLNNFVSKYVCNIIDFLNERDVIYVDHTTSDKTNKNRVKRGKLPKPDYKAIRVTNELKIQLDKILSNDEINYTHKFFVRGHFRVLRNSDKYKENTGKRIWIAPYIKGNGVLINKTYEVKNG